MRGLTLTLTLTLTLAFAAAAAAQDAAPVTTRAIAGADATAVGVLWSHGVDDDPPGRRGVARVLAECRLRRALLAAPSLSASGVRVGGDYSLVFGVTRDVAAATAFVGALLDDDAAPSDDEVALSVARLALAADDARHLYPGSGLRQRARAALFGDGPGSAPVDGVAEDLQALTVADVRAALRRPVAARGAALGVIDAALLPALAALPWPQAPAVAGRPRVAARAAERALWQEHARVDSPFVAAAFAAPAGDQLPAFAVAVEVARARLGRRFKLRGSELQARAPLVSWSWLAGDPLVLFCRRGEHGAPLLPGERQEATALDEAEAVRRELQDALADLAQQAPTDAEVATARARLVAELALPSAGEVPPWANEPALLPGRLMALLLARHHGIDVDALAGVSAGDVAGALRRFDAAGGAWQGVVPAPRADLGFRRR